MSGTSKSGRPIEKLIGSFIFAARSKTLRMPEASTPLERAERKSLRLRGIVGWVLNFGCCLMIVERRSSLGGRWEFPRSKANNPQSTFNNPPAHARSTQAHQGAHVCLA